MEDAPADEAADMGEQTTIEEELFIRVCDLYDVLDVYLSELSEPLDSAVVQEEVAVA